MDEHEKWKQARGDETYALDWDINSDSLVWEIGGFEGRWAAQMAERYNPHMDIFEPQPWAQEKLRQRFYRNKKIDIHPYGLWVTNCHLPLYGFETDGASLLGNGIRFQLCEFRDVFTELDGNVDVCLMNIEGGEYVLLPFLIGHGYMRNFRYFWCQFHLFVEESAERTRIIYAKMAETHRVKWDFFPSAVCWERK